MAPHDRNSANDKQDDAIYASGDLAVSMPKQKFPERELNPRHVYAAIHDELMLDGNARQNLATFCQTWTEPEVNKLMDECIDKNMIDKDEYPQTARYLAGEIGRLGPFEVLYGGDMNRGIPALCWKLKEGTDPGFSL